MRSLGKKIVTEANRNKKNSQWGPWNKNNLNKKKFTLKACRPMGGDRGYFWNISKRTYIFEIFIFFKYKKEKSAEKRRVKAQQMSFGRPGSDEVKFGSDRFLLLLCPNFSPCKHNEVKLEPRKMTWGFVLSVPTVSAHRGSDAWLPSIVQSRFNFRYQVYVFFAYTVSFDTISDCSVVPQPNSIWSSVPVCGPSEC